MSGLDSRYISSIDLEPYFVSNQNGEANAYGVVTFYVDTSRTTKKDVFQLTQDPLTGAYSYAALPNPIILSGVGTFQNAGGDNVAVYYYPFDEFGNQELYYITVYDQFGNLQFTREAWPFPNSGSGGGSIQEIFIGLTNQLQNPQFADIFYAGPTLNITIGGAGTTTYNIAPGWVLSITATGASTVDVTRTPVVGQSKLPYNPPYTLDFTIGANITECKLIQTLNNNPDWAAPQTAGVMGYLSGSILLSDTTSVFMKYKPSVGTEQTIIDATNTTGAYVQESATIELVAANNTDNGDTGYDQIIIYLRNLPGTAKISNIQAIPLTTNVTGVQYDQTPVNRQRAFYSQLIDTVGGYYGQNTGRLTLTSGTPVTTGDVTSATLYYTPYKGNTIWLYVNGKWTLYTYNELSIASPGILNQVYDVFASVETGTNVTLVLVVWATETARTTNLALQDGVYVESGNTKRRYLGTVFVDSSLQFKDSVNFRYVWNYYNRIMRTAQYITTDTRWTYTLPVWRQANGSTAYQANLVVGLIEDVLYATVFQNAAMSLSLEALAVGIGINSTTINSAQQFGNNCSANSVFTPVTCAYSGTGYGIGYNQIAWLEFSDTGVPGNVTGWAGIDVGLTGFDSGMGITVNFPM